MPKINLQQGTDFWKKWREGLITASDAAKVMGSSPYGSKYSLWLEKKGLREPQPFNANMKYGTEMEPIIRDHIEEENGVGFLPCCYQSDEMPFIGASLDGINFDETQIIEIKCCNKDVFTQALTGTVVDHYLIQVLVQLICVPTSQTCEVWFYHNNSKSGQIHPIDITSVTIDRDDYFDDIESIKKELTKFHESLQVDKAPEPTSDDYIFIDSVRFKQIEAEWIDSCAKLAEAKALEAKARELLFAIADDRNIQSDRIKVTKVYRSGTVDWKALCKDKDITDDDLSLYRKDTVEYYKPTILSS